MATDEPQQGLEKGELSCSPGAAPHVVNWDPHDEA